MAYRTNQPQGSLAGLDAEQRANAALITRVGQKLGASARDIAVAITTAMDESSLHNLTGGDRDSAGLFQQRPSQGWGTYAQVTNPTYAATKFFRSLFAVKNRNSLTPWMEAQSVQRSGFPTGSNYEQYWLGAANGFHVSGPQIAAALTGMPLGQLNKAAAGAGGFQGAGGGTFTFPDPLAPIPIPNPGGVASSAILGPIIKIAFSAGAIVLVVLGAKQTAGRAG